MRTDRDTRFDMRGNPKAVLSWSTGKDSAFALAEVRRIGELDIVGLITTVTRDVDRVSMHGVRRVLLDRQAAATKLPLQTVEIPLPCPNAVYEEAFASELSRARDAGVDHVVFGDLFLADIRAYREAQLTALGMTAVFPLWGRDTGSLAREMIASGIRARLTCVDPRQLDRAFVGRQFDDALLDELPASVDPCGERGEFHTFATRSPMFDRAIEIAVGETVERDGFVFVDLVPSPVA